MKETSQRYLNSEAHGYLMEAKAYKLLLKDLERIRAKLRRHIEKEAADREAEFEAAMQYHSESDIQAVSYTHLDVYKRQGNTCTGSSCSENSNRFSKTIPQPYAPPSHP